MQTRIILALLGLALACADSTGPENTRPDSELDILVFPDSIASRLPREVSFWAKKGEDRTVSLSFLGGNNEDDDDDGDDDDEGEFLQFDVPADALLRYPDGTLFQDGDSVRITITVDPANRFLFTFEPAGLEFDPENPAELEIEFEVLEGDLDDDGDADEDDEARRQQLDIWKQLQPGSPWMRLNGSLRIDVDEIEADITSFSLFCIAT